MSSTLAERLADVQERIASACRRAGRRPEGVRLVAVSKTKPVDLLLEGIQAGVAILGESYIQEAQPKIETIGHPVEWHFIGRLQSNKAKFAVRIFDLIHSVDSLKLAQEINKRAADIDRRQPVLISVNLGGEESKSGLTADQTPELAARIMEMPNLELRGLMTVPPPADEPEDSRPYFAALRELKEKIGQPLTELSMGMSGDYEVAVEEGATLVRIGTAIFGPRDYGSKA